MVIQFCWDIIRVSWISCGGAKTYIKFKQKTKGNGQIDNLYGSAGKGHVSYRPAKHLLRKSIRLDVHLRHIVLDALEVLLWVRSIVI